MSKTQRQASCCSLPALAQQGLRQNSFVMQASACGGCFLLLLRLQSFLASGTAKPDLNPKP